jgi:hypothetical protein
MKSRRPRRPAPSLQRFTLEELAPFTKEGTFASNASQDFHLFYVGRDDVHGILKYLLARATTSLYLNMFGYDDEELNQECMRCALDRSITTVITLDKSQSGGKHEKAILDSDVAKDPVAFQTHFVVGQSATHQISHTKGGVLDGRVGFEGSTNWSASGEGTFLLKGGPGGPGYKAQNNTLAVFTDPDTIARFTAELVAEHLAARGAREVSRKARSTAGQPDSPTAGGRQARGGAKGKGGGIAEAFGTRRVVFARGRATERGEAEAFSTEREVPRRDETGRDRNGGPCGGHGMRVRVRANGRVGDSYGRRDRGRRGRGIGRATRDLGAGVPPSGRVSIARRGRTGHGAPGEPSW